MGTFRVVTALLVMICACNRDPAEFVGTWRYDDTSTLTQQCEKAADGDFLVSATFTLVESTTADIEKPTGSAGCAIKLYIQGSTAEAEDQTCPVELAGSGCPVVSGSLSYSVYTLGLSSDGNHLGIEERYSGLSGPNGCTPDMCSFVLIGSATRVE
jgi:hypothetical protein